MKDKTKFSEFMTIIAEMFEKTPSKAILEVYWKSIGPYSDDDCVKAFNEIIVKSRFFPKPVDIIETIRGTGTNRATGAWIKVLGTLRGVGSYQSVQFDDPVIHSVIETMGGWPEMGNLLVDDEKWKQREFEKLYPIMEKRGNHPTHLSGKFELDNTAKGYLDYNEEPVKIGFDETKQIEG